MAANIIQLSLVVLGDEHNPTILNPNFLEDQEIIPKDWKWRLSDDPPLTTPPLSRVSYSNGVVITVQREKLQILDSSVSTDIAKSKATEIVNKYVEVLPHVHYLATGTNFTAFVECPNPMQLLKDRFLKEGDWLNSPTALKELGLRFAYPLENGNVIFNLDVGIAENIVNGQAVRKDVIIIKANYHRECSPNTYQKVISNFTHLSADLNGFRQMVKQNLDTDL